MHNCATPEQGGLLKEKLELVKVKSKDGRTRTTIAPIPDELSFEKVRQHGR